MKCAVGSDYKPEHLGQINVFGETYRDLGQRTENGTFGHPNLNTFSLEEFRVG